jgi:enoyl-CoA hydratase/carnithine racemase
VRKPDSSISITIVTCVYRVAAKVGRAKALEWALTSEQAPAAEMERRGLINRVVADETLLDEAAAWPPVRPWPTQRTRRS